MPNFMKTRLVPSCSEVTELATDYMERSLRLRTHIGVLVHLAACTKCRTYMDQLNRTIALLRGRPLGPPSPGTAERVARQATRNGPDSPGDPPR